MEFQDLIRINSTELCSTTHALTDNERNNLKLGSFKLIMWRVCILFQRLRLGYRVMMYQENCYIRASYLFLILLIKLHPVAFMTFSYSVHLFISIPQDRPVKVIYICFEKTVLNMVQSQFDILVLNFGICYQWNSEMLHQKYRSKQN